jgi:hypothetical protein
MVEPDCRGGPWRSVHEWVAEVRRPRDAQSADWNSSTILGGYNADAIRSLKDGIDGDIYVSGSGTLVRAMLADDLVEARVAWEGDVATGLNWAFATRF